MTISAEPMASGASGAAGPVGGNSAITDRKTKVPTNSVSSLAGRLIARNVGTRGRLRASPRWRRRPYDARVPGLGADPPIAFVATIDPVRSRAFYEGVLGCSFVADEGFAL